MNYENKSYYINKDVEKWQNLEIPKQGHKTFIKSIKISPFYIDLSAELNLKKLGLENNQLLNTILSAVGVVVSNIEDAPIRLSGMSITNCIDTSEGLTQKIISQYKGDVINQFYKIFGSLNIIGNPMGLLRNISTGFEDFAQKPAKGFVNGPAEFGKGIVQGTGSLVAHSVGGAFNSLSKITGTVSTGLATLSFDEEFE
jgi:vacuolar protein sorting-associated protein 13A/C